jgi:hypothetical protein
MNKTESSAGLTLAIGSGLSIVAAIIAISLGLNHNQGIALFFLLLAVMGSIITWNAYQRYRELRGERWKRELAETESELNRVLKEQEARTMSTPPDSGSAEG